MTSLDPPPQETQGREQPGPPSDQAPPSPTPGTASGEVAPPAGGEDTPERFTQISLTQRPAVAMWKALHHVFTEVSLVRLPGDLDINALDEAHDIVKSTLELEGWL